MKKILLSLLCFCLLACGAPDSHMSDNAGQQDSVATAYDTSGVTPAKPDASPTPVTADSAAPPDVAMATPDYVDHRASNKPNPSSNEPRSSSNKPRSSSESVSVPASGEGRSPAGSMDHAVSSIPETASDSVGATLVDTANVSVPMDTVRKSAILGYSYFKKIKQQETRNITAYVSVKNPSHKVVDTLKDINAEIPPERPDDTASIFTQNIMLYSYLDLTLIDPDKDFTITPIHESSRQKINDAGGNLWQWSVTPKTTKANARLTLKVVAEKPDGTREAFQTKTIPIRIQVDRNIFRTIYIWLYENPEKALTLLIIPFVAFFWKQIVALFKGKKKDN